jgi:uncharacterized protein (TIGR02588 family)
VRQNWLEWVVLGISVATVVGLVGFLVLDGITDDGRPPQPVVEVRPGDAYNIASGWILPAIARNDGDVAAESLALRATATVDGAEEESEVTIDFLPSGSEVEVSFGFTGPPDGDVTVTVVGFRLP